MGDSYSILVKDPPNIRSYGDFDPIEESLKFFLKKIECKKKGTRMGLSLGLEVVAQGCIILRGLGIGVILGPGTSRQPDSEGQPPMHMHRRVGPFQS